MAVAADIAPVRRRVRDRAAVAVVTSPGGRDEHTHCAVFDSAGGDGLTSPGADGHVHEVIGLEVLAARGHTHELTEHRCPADHNARANHVRPRARDAR